MHSTSISTVEFLCMYTCFGILEMDKSSTDAQHLKFRVLFIENLSI